MFSLRPYETKLVEVASLDESKSGAEIQLHYESTSYVNVVPQEKYELEIAIYGAHKPRRAKFTLSVDGTGRLRMRSVA